MMTQMVTLNFVVDNDLSNYSNTSSGFATKTGTETLTNKTINSPKSQRRCENVKQLQQKSTY